MRRSALKLGISLILIIASDALPKVSFLFSSSSMRPLYVRHFKELENICINF